MTAEGEPDEDALSEAGAFELEAFGPGQSCSATYDLKPGTYTLHKYLTPSPFSGRSVAASGYGPSSPRFRRRFHQRPPCQPAAAAPRRRRSSGG